MLTFTPPLEDIRFALQTSANLPSLLALSENAEITEDLIEGILEGAAKFAEREFAPLYRSGDVERLSLVDGSAVTPKGFRGAYGRYVEDGWSTLPFDSSIGGQGLGLAVTTAVTELWSTANVAMGLFLMPVQGAVKLLQRHGDPWQRETMIPKLVEGRWGATMSMTEPQAGSDLGLLRCKAIPHTDGTYRLFGQKALISLASHDLVQNVIQFVLARLPGAPSGVKGLTLFAVPTRLLGKRGELGERNDVRYISLEHKMGVHAMPTGVVQYGEADGAVGYLVGATNRGMECLFTLMNRARVAIGVLALGNAERAYRQAVYYANERVQGRDATGRREGSVAIIEHPDVRRMLMSMKARVEAIRHFCYYTAALIDRAERNAEAPGGASLLRRIELLTPLLKSYCSEQGFDIASLSMQVHGGTGYIEESGIPQLLRDARVHPIYEGTTGIQAIDLVTRKLARDEGACLDALLDDMQTTVGALDGKPALRPIATVLSKSIQDVRAANRYMLDRLSPDPAEALAGSVPYLNLVATTVAGWLMAQAALSAPERFSIDFIRSKQATARFFAEHFLVATSGLLHTVREGAAATLALDRHYF